MRISAAMQAHNSCGATEDTNFLNNIYYVFQQHISNIPTKRGWIINLWHTLLFILFKFSYRIFIQQEIKYVHKYDAVIVLVFLDEVACYHILYKTIVYT